MSEQRAILVSEEQAEACGSKETQLWPLDYVALRRAVAKAFDAAVDQPRARWCVEHGAEAWSEKTCWIYDCAMGVEPPPCRVVDAIVCVLEEPA